MSARESIWIRYFVPLNEAGRWDKGLLERFARVYERRCAVVMFLSWVLHGMTTAGLATVAHPRDVSDMVQGFTLAWSGMCLAALFYVAAFVWIQALWQRIEQSRSKD